MEANSIGPWITYDRPNDYRLENTALDTNEQNIQIQ